MFPGGPPEQAIHHSKVWKEALQMFGETYIPDRGGVDNTVFVYCVEPLGRFSLSETDVYPDPLDPGSLQKCIAITVYGLVKNASEKNQPFGFGFSAEPFTSFFPEQGPDAYLFFRKMRKIFDPHGISSPGRQVFTEEEYKAFPQQMADGINQMRQLMGMRPVER